MTNIQAKIREDAEKARVVYRQVQALFLRRNESTEALAAWVAARKTLPVHLSPLTPLFWFCEWRAQLETGDPDLVELALSFVEANPYFAGLFEED